MTLSAGRYSREDALSPEKNVTIHKAPKYGAKVLTFFTVPTGITFS